jgi:hypothetical protein
MRCTKYLYAIYIFWPESTILLSELREGAEKSAEKGAEVGNLGEEDHVVDALVATEKSLGPDVARF